MATIDLATPLGPAEAAVITLLGLFLPTVVFVFAAIIVRQIWGLTSCLILIAGYLLGTLTTLFRLHLLQR